MKAKNNLLYLFIICAFAPFTVQAKYVGPFIIIDKDGYTNIRKGPNGKSEIVGKVYKHQLLFLKSSYDEDEQEIIVNYTDSTWIPVYNDSINGYIYKEKVLDLNKLPRLKSKINFNDDKTQGSIVCSNDSLIITMAIQPFELKEHRVYIRWQGDTCISTNALDITSIDEHDFWGIESCLPANEIKELKIKDNEYKKWIRRKDIHEYFNVRDMSVFIGLNGELYVVITGGESTWQYLAYLTVIGRDVVYEFVDW